MHNELVILAADAQHTLGFVARALQLEGVALMDCSNQLREREAAVSIRNGLQHVDLATEPCPGSNLKSYSEM